MITAIILFLVFIGLCLIGHAWLSIIIGIVNRKKFDSFTDAVEYGRYWPRRLFGFKEK